MNKTAIVIALGALFVVSPLYASEADLMQRLDKLASELENVKSELKKLKEEKEARAKEPQAPVAMTASTSAAPASTSSQSSITPMRTAITNQTTLFGYGEMNYNRPRKDTSQTQADLRRAVLGVGHRFDEKTELGMELEFEHAVTSASDKGEVEVEQLWIDHHLSDKLTLRAGLFLVPVGLINERHEPTTFYGVERNFVETAIIPTTWREGGVMLRGNTDDQALTWNVGVSTGFDLTKWNANSSDGRESPLRSIHQELQLAKAHDLSVLGAINYRGIPGLTVGGFIFTGKAAHRMPAFAAPDARVSLWDLHARWTPGAWDLSALYAKGTISNTQALNLTFVGSPTLVPKEFWGWYAEAAYKMWNQGDYSLAPFIRYERFNTAAKFADLGAGLTPEAAATEGVATVGANFKLNANVVFKADYQKFKVDTGRDRFNLGLGYMF